MLEGLIPRLLNNYKEMEINYITFQGKQDLKSKLYERLRGWLIEDSVFVVLVDQDIEDCKQLKKSISQKCKSKPSSNFIIRIACRELESWYWGDLAAVEKALDKKNLAKKYQNKSKYKNTDQILRPSEELKKITDGAYQKFSSSEAIGPLLSLDKNRSPSFQTFIKRIKELNIKT